MKPLIVAALLAASPALAENSPASPELPEEVTDGLAVLWEPLCVTHGHMLVQLVGQLEQGLVHKAETVNSQIRQTRDCIERGYLTVRDVEMMARGAWVSRDRIRNWLN